MLYSAIKMLAMCGLVAGEVYFEESFSNGLDKWTMDKMEGKEMGEWKISPGKWFVGEEVNKGLQPRTCASTPSRRR